MPDPIRPEDIPAELVEILDQRAGKQHSTGGPVLAALAEILTAHRRLVAEEIAAAVEARAAEAVSRELMFGPCEEHDRHHCHAVAAEHAARLAAATARQIGGADES